MQRRHVRALMLAALVVGGGIPAAADLLINEPQTPFDGGDDGMVVGVSNGPQISLAGSGNISNPADGTGGDTVELNTTGGNLSVTGGAQGAATVRIDDITGKWTNISDLSVNDTTLRFAPEDKTHRVGVGGAATALNFTNVTVDDGDPDLVYRGATGQTRLSIGNLTAEQWYILRDVDTGNALIQARADDTGRLSVSAPNSKHVVSVETAAALNVAAQHTTDSDFNAATELTNVSVSGLGQGASVALNSTGGSGFTYATGFDNEPADTGIPEEFADEGGNHNVSSVHVFNGTQSYAGEASGGSSRANHSLSSGTLDSFNVSVYAQGRADIKLRQAGSTIGPVLVSVRNGDLQYFNGSFQTIDTAPDAAEFIEINISDIDAAADTYRVTYCFDGGASCNTSTADMNGDMTARGYDNFEIGAQSGQAFFDQVEVGTNPPTGVEPTGRYISQNVSADASTLAANATAENASLNVSVEEWTGSQWQLVNSSNLTTTGNQTIDISAATNTKLRTNVTFRSLSGSTTAELHDETFLFNSSAPALDGAAATPQGGTTQQSTSVTFEVPLNDSDFGTPQGDNVSVDIYIDGNLATTLHRQSNGTVSTTQTVPNGGSHTWSAVARSQNYSEPTDSIGNLSFQVPSDLFIRPERSPNGLVNNSTVTVQFFGSNIIVERSTDDGIINLTGLPADETFIVEGEAGGFFNRTAIIPSLAEQQSLYLLNQSASAIQVRFVIDSRVPEFTDPETLVIIEKALNRSGTTQFERISADETGANGHIVQLQDQGRYRISVQAPDGTTASLGAFDADTTVTNPVRLQPGTASFGLSGSENVTGVLNVSSSTSGQGGSKTQTLSLQYRDDSNETSALSVTIHEAGNSSNTLTTVTPPGGAFPLGTFTFSTTVSGAPANTSWVANYSYTRDGEGVSGVKPFGQAGQYGLGIPLDDGWQAIFGIGFLLVLGGVFSVGNARIGALIIPGVALALWQTGFIDGAATLAGIGLAFTIAVGYNIAQTSGVVLNK